MDIKLGTHVFENVAVPLVWGDRAVLQDNAGHLSVINLGAAEPRIEILGDNPAPGVEFLPTAAGFEIRQQGRLAYTYDPSEKLLSTGSLHTLPDCQVRSAWIRVGSSHFPGTLILGTGVGIVVSGQSVSVGAPLPEKLVRVKR